MNEYEIEVLTKKLEAYKAGDDNAAVQVCLAAYDIGVASKEAENAGLRSRIVTLLMERDSARRLLDEARSLLGEFQRALNKALDRP